MVSRRELFAEITAVLEKSGNDCAHFDAQCIFEHVFERPLPMVLMEGNTEVPSETADTVRSLTKRRAEHFPLQYILGQWEFFGYPFKVGEGVLIPRPDTETLVEQILDICREKGLKSPKIADLCSGSGCIAITLKKELPEAEVTAVELSDNALSYLRENTILNNVNINIIKGDVLDENTAAAFNELDIIVSNPPYLTEIDMNELMEEVRHEPQTALFGGKDGFDYYETMTRIWKNSLRKGGFLAYEFGLDQHDEVSRILAEKGFENIQLRRDTAGIIRTAAAERR